MRIVYFNSFAPRSGLDIRNNTQNKQATLPMMREIELTPMQVQKVVAATFRGGMFERINFIPTNCSSCGGK